MLLGSQVKDPESTQPISIDWAAHIGALTISNSVWIMPTGITAEGTPILGGSVTAQQVSGGQEGEDYIVTNRVTLSDASIIDGTVRLKIRTGAEDPRIG